jgi:hypothetical protein
VPKLSQKNRQRKQKTNQMDTESKRLTMYYNGIYTYIETEIVFDDATPEQVWEVFADFASWPRWCTFMTFLEAPLAVGKRCGVVCKLSQGPMKTSTHWPMVEKFDAGRELLWRDFNALIAPFWHGCHWFRFAPTPCGRGTRLRHGTRQMGLAMPALWDAMVSTELGYHAFNNELAAEVKRRQCASAATGAAAAAAAATSTAAGGPAAAAVARATGKKAAAGALAGGRHASAAAAAAAAAKKPAAVVDAGFKSPPTPRSQV